MVTELMLKLPIVNVPIDTNVTIADELKNRRHSVLSYNK